MVKRAAPKAWAPDRQDVICIGCNPQRGQEIRDVHPFLVLSPRAFNERTSLVIGLPMTTASYNADNPFAISVGVAGGRKAGQASFVLCHQPQSFDWRLRGGAPHPMKRITDAALPKCLLCLTKSFS